MLVIRPHCARALVTLGWKVSFCWSIKFAELDQMCYIISCVVPSLGFKIVKVHTLCWNRLSPYTCKRTDPNVIETSLLLYMEGKDTDNTFQLQRRAKVTRNYFIHSRICVSSQVCQILYQPRYNITCNKNYVCHPSTSTEDVVTSTSWGYPPKKKNLSNCQKNYNF